MQPLQITFRNIEPSKTIEGLVRLKARKLERFHGRIIKCRVTVETQQQRRHEGNLYDVRVDIEIPGKIFAVSSQQQGSPAYEFLSRAVRGAFETAERQLRDYAGSRRDLARVSIDSHYNSSSE